ncbi:OmpA family protein [Nitriliruptor alkaliphilus]|uniref:OmpA family protein n=1 Tax=Nitriliruptor alkaliphilus TaxID=427918 RepID=UPI0014707A6E|nr:OmpA family protein [Nitriliruptor alkaliphilus]
MTPTTIDLTEPGPVPPTTVTVREPDAAPVTSVEIRVGEVIESFAGETTSEGTMLTLEETILFDFDSAELRDGADGALDDLVEVLEYYDAAPVEIGGHTDGLGSDEYNDQLSLERAEAVVQGLVDRGVPASRLTAQGYGSRQPVAEEELGDGSDDPDGRAANRRVEVLIVGVEPPS